MSGADSIAALVVTVGARACAIPLAHVRETLRPLAVEPLTGVPDYVRGVSVIRGQPVPVVDLAALLGEAAGDGAARLVVLQMEERQVALAVHAVIGLRRLESAGFGALPPLLDGAAQQAVEAVGVRDAQLLLMLRTSRLITDELWAKLALRSA